MKQFDPEQNRIFEAITGSQLYGTDTPESDTDYRGICIPPMDVLLNPFYPFEQKDSGFEEEDRTLYSLDKFFRLCADSNPNIVELLFVPFENVVFHSKYWSKILKNKQYFLSKKARFKFTGYAFSQLHKIKAHREWFINPPSKKPERSDFGLGGTSLVSGENLSAVTNLPFSLFKDEVSDEIRREKEYRLVKKKWDDYMSWFKNRNPKRRELEEMYQYDTKAAYHLFRLMTEGKELLLTGNITFPLPNAEEIRAIKNGLYTYEEVLEKAELLDSEFEIWYNESILPNKPNRNKLIELYFEIIEEYHNDHPNQD